MEAHDEIEEFLFDVEKVIADLTAMIEKNKIEIQEIHRAIDELRNFEKLNERLLLEVSDVARSL